MCDISFLSIISAVLNITHAKQILRVIPLWAQNLCHFTAMNNFLARFLSQEVNFFAEPNSLKQHLKSNIFSAALIVPALHLNLIFQFLYQVFFTAPDLQHLSTTYSVNNVFHTK